MGESIQSAAQGAQTRQNRAGRTATGGKRVLCVVDFSTIPYTFDVLIYLFVADKFRREQGADILDVAVVAHASDPAVRHQTHHSEADLKHRFRAFANNLGVGGARLVPSLGSVFMFDNRTLFARYLDATRRAYMKLFPEYYDPRAPLQRLSNADPELFCYTHLTDGADAQTVRSMAVPAREQDYARRWLRKYVYPAIPITLTLRHIPYQSYRNSNIASLADALNSIDDSRVRFVLLPDYHEAFGAEAIAGPNVIYCHEATLTLPLRAAFYGAASFNIFGNNGPVSMGFLSNAMRYIYFITLEDEGEASAADIAHSENMQIGGQIWGAGPFQRTVWGADDVPGMRAAILRMIDDLTAQESLAPGWYAESA